MRKVLFIVALLSLCAQIVAQETVAAPEPIELDAKVEFVKVYNGQTRVDVHIFEKAMPQRPMEDVLVNLHLSEVSKGGMMGSLITDKDGFCSFVMVKKFEAANDTIDEYYYICRIAHDERFKSVNLYYTFYKSDLKVDFIERKGGAERLIQGVFKGLNENKDTIPIAGAKVTVLVKSGEEYKPLSKRSLKTAADGSFTYDFDKAVAADQDGKLHLMVKLEHEDYGTSEFLQTVEWGLSAEEMRAQQAELQKKNLGLVILAAFLLAVYMMVRRYRKKLSN